MSMAANPAARVHIPRVSAVRPVSSQRTGQARNFQQITSPQSQSSPPLAAVIQTLARIVKTKRN